MKQLKKSFSDFDKKKQEKQEMCRRIGAFEIVVWDFFYFHFPNRSGGLAPPGAFYDMMEYILSGKPPIV